MKLQDRPNTIEYNKEFTDEFVIIEVIAGKINPEILKTTRPPHPVLEGFADKGVIIRGGEDFIPIWLCGYLVSFYHTAQFVAVFDPGRKGAVVIRSRTVNYMEGDIITHELLNLKGKSEK